MSSEFLEALGFELPPDERLIVCGFAGDPATAGPTAWRPRPWRVGMPVGVGAGANAYVTVASFRQAADGTFRRRGEVFAAGRALMVDDVGVGPSARVDPAVVAGVPPSARVLTSPGNEQWWYLLSEPERDAVRFDGVIRAFITGKLLGSDPGMAGIARVGRLPGFTNGKAKYGGHFRTELMELNAHRYTVEELLAGFGLFINGRNVPAPYMPTEKALERNQAFLATYKFLEQRGMLKRREPDLSGWTECTCPWVGDHTGAADNGAAIREPAEENFWGGSFRCHHGSHLGRGLRELTEWINEQAVDELDKINKDAA